MGIWGYGWGESESLKTPNNLERHVAKLGFWVGKITHPHTHTKKKKKKKKCQNWGASPQPPFLGRGFDPTLPFS